jgi:hypothetical protein
MYLKGNACQAAIPAGFCCFGSYALRCRSTRRSAPAGMVFVAGRVGLPCARHHRPSDHVLAIINGLAPTFLSAAACVPGRSRAVVTAWWAGVPADAVSTQYIPSCCPCRVIAAGGDARASPTDEVLRLSSRVRRLQSGETSCDPGAPGPNQHATTSLPNREG